MDRGAPARGTLTRRLERVRTEGEPGILNDMEPVGTAVRAASAAHPRTVDAPVDPVAGQALLRAIQAELPDVRLLTEATDRESYREDETPYLHPGLPLAVALPATTAEVSALVRLAGRHRVPIVPRGAGTGLSGGAAGIEGGLTVALTRMDRLLEIDRENMVAVVQPGLINAALKRAVAAEGLFYGPDPASFEMCSIGGNLGTNAGGLCCVKYGQTRDWVLSLEVVLADGAVIRTGGKNLKDTAGYSLTHLFVGSQGTLGIITEATLRLRPAPPPRSTLLVFFPTLVSAAAAVSGFTAAGVQPVTLEILDKFTIAAVDDWHHLGLDRDAAAMLMIESDLPQAAADDELDRAVRVCEEAGSTVLVRATDPTEGDWLRQARRTAHGALERSARSRWRTSAFPEARSPRCWWRSRRSPTATTSGSEPSATSATATSTRTSSSTATIRAPRSSPRPRGPRCIGRRWPWAGPSRPSTASGWHGATSWSFSVGRTRFG